MAKNSNKAQKRSKQALVAAPKHLEIFKLYKDGYTMRDIGERIGLSHTRIFQVIQEELKELREQRTQLANEVLDLELRRLDDMQKPLMDKCERGDEASIYCVLKIMERRAKLLGIDKPQKVEHSGEVTLEHLLLGTKPGDSPVPHAPVKTIE